MTQQEFVKKIDKPGVYIGAYADGLTKGLDIAKEFAEWIDGKFFKPEGYWTEVYEEKTPSSYTTDELLTIFLTEKYGQ